MKKDKISVIIPIYNAERTINRCLDSVCNQSYKNLEIILVNDGSTDSTTEIIENWRSKDPRIIIVEQKNMGAAAARNMGLENITGQFFTFVDADDTIEKEIYEKLYEEAISKNLDIVSASIREIYKGDKIEVRRNSDNMQVLSGIEAACAMLKYEGGIRTVVWDKLYRTEKMKEVRFRKDYVFGEDTLFNFQTFMYCNRYGRISYIGYTYDHRESQVTGKKYSSKKLSNVYVAEDIKEIYSEMTKSQTENSLKYPELNSAIMQFQVTIYRQIFYSMILGNSHKGKGRKDYKSLKNAALKVDKAFVKKYLEKRDYIQWLMYLHCPIGFQIIHTARHFHNSR